MIILPKNNIRCLCFEKHPLQGQSPYSASKIGADKLAESFFRSYDLPVVTLRPFNTYGPRMHPNDGRVVSNFILQALGNENITVHGEGNQTRSFCYVDDLIDGLIKLMNTEDAVTGPVNLGNPHEITIMELAEKIINVSGSQSLIEKKPLPSDDPLRRKPDIQLARKILSWQPQTPLNQGLEKTISFFKNPVII